VKRVGLFLWLGVIAECGSRWSAAIAKSAGKWRQRTNARGTGGAEGRISRAVARQRNRGRQPGPRGGDDGADPGGSESRYGADGGTENARLLWTRARAGRFSKSRT